MDSITQTYERVVDEMKSSFSPYYAICQRCGEYVCECFDIGRD